MIKTSIKIKSIALILAIVLMAGVLTLSMDSVDVADALDLNGVEFSSLWQYGVGGLDIAGAKSVVNTWDLSGIKESIVIGVIDTGIQVSHPIFTNVLIRDDNDKVVGYNVLSGNGNDLRDASADNYHGTGVASVIAMLIEEFGLSDYIKIYPIKANTKDTKTFTVKSLISAIENAKEQGVDVINMSLGYTQDKYNALKQDERNKFEFAIENARQNALIVAAAGNSTSPQIDTKFYPAILGGTISVMGYGKNGRVFETSNYGSIYDICAPGEDIVTASNNSRYTTTDGTSVACANVSFASALLKLRYLANGEELSVADMERYIRSLQGKTAVKSDVHYPALSLNAIVSQDFENVVKDYVNPNQLTIAHNGTLGSDDNEDYVFMLANNKTPTTFYAQLGPSGMVDPDITGMVEWSLALIERDSENIISEQKLDAKGSILEFLPPRGGDFLLIARLELFNLQAQVLMHVEYLPYLVGEVRVTYASSVSQGVDKAPSSGVLYTNDSTTFALTGLEYLNPDKEIKWYVNGEYVESSPQFVFTPTKAGTYYISAQYGDEGKVDFEYRFKAEVKSFILRPLDLTMLCVGIAVLVTITVVVCVLAVRKKKLAENK